MATNYVPSTLIDGKKTEELILNSSEIRLCSTL
jgi:hypothetical protein